MINRLIDVLSRTRQRLSKPSTSRWLMLLATLTFAGVTYAAITNLPPDVGSIDWVSVSIACLLILPISWLLGLEFKEIATISGHRFATFEAFRISLLASASNLLPIPGAVAVKTGKLMAAGRSAKASIGSNVIVGILWVAIVLLIGAPFAVPEAPLLAWVSIGSGLVMGAIGVLGLFRGARAPSSTLIRVIAIEVGLTVLATIQIWFVMLAIGVEPSLRASVWLVVVSVISTVIGLFPAGLGLREAMSAAVAPLIGLDPAVAVLISAVARIIRMGVLALLGALVAVVMRRSSTV